MTARTARARVNRPLSATLESMLGHPAIQRSAADSEGAGRRRDVAVMSCQRPLDRTALERIELQRLRLAPRAGQLRRSRDGGNQLVVAPGLEHEVRGASFQRI